MQEGKAYHCFCTPEELEAERKAQTDAKEDPRYSGKCRMLSNQEREDHLAAGRAPTVRLKVPGGVVGFNDLVRGWIEWDTNLMGDFIILKSSGIPVYNFATVIDDHLMDISHVTRGAEHIANTFSQILIYQALGWELPEFAHFSIMLNEDRTKMSKRKGATFIGQYADMGYLPEAMLNFLAFLGWSPGTTEDEIYTLEQLISEFSLERCTSSNAVFDIKKLDWINAKWIRRLAPADVAERMVPFLQRAGMLANAPDMRKLEKIAILIQERLHRLDEAPALCSFFLSDPEVPAQELSEVLAQVDGKAGLTEVARVLATVDWDEPAIEENLRGLQKDLGWSTKVYFMSLRLAVLGSKVSPPLFGSIEVIGRDNSIARINRAINSL
jgi:glutamyl-tRNA synthetase